MSQLRINLTAEQMADCHRVAGYAGEDVETWALSLIAQALENDRKLGVWLEHCRSTTPSLPTDDDGTLCSGIGPSLNDDDPTRL